MSQLVRATVEINSPLLDGPLVMDFIASDDDGVIKRRALGWAFAMYNEPEFLGHEDWVTITDKTTNLHREKDSDANSDS